MGDQLKHWTGEVGRAYQERNPYEPRSAVPYFERAAAGRNITSILEVGCNLGSKLGAWLTALPGVSISGVEPNAEAVAKAAAIPGVTSVVQGDAYKLPFADESFDLVFSSGVFMHIPSNRINEAAGEAVRVAKRYVLAIEHYSESEQEIQPAFRGVPHMWFSRDYQKLYSQFPSLTFLYREPYREWYLTDTFVWLFGKNGAK